MICQRCLRASSRLRPSHRSSIISPSTSTLNPAPLLRIPHLSFSTTSSQQTQPTQPQSAPPPAATSTSAAQPFSTPLTPSPAAEGTPTKPAPTASVVTLSSVPAGTPLKGLNFLKNAQDPVALEDSEYPSWLWDILKKEETKGDGAGEGDLFSKSKKQRRLAAKRLRKQELRDPDALAPKIPIYEQSIDLPAGNGTVQGAIQAAAVRKELQKAMRVKRRGTIKEGNFLKTMG